MIRLMRSIRSLAYNRTLQPLVEDRIERAEASLRGYLMASGLSSARIGPYEVEVDEEGDISLERLSTDDWQQLGLPQLDGSQGLDRSTGGDGDLTDFDIPERLLVRDLSSPITVERRQP